MDLSRSIIDAKAAITEIRDVTQDLDGVVVDRFISTLTSAASELEDYLLSDAEEAAIKIDKLESKLSELEFKIEGP